MSKLEWRLRISLVESNVLFENDDVIVNKLILLSLIKSEYNMQQHYLNIYSQAASRPQKQVLRSKTPQKDILIDAVVEEVHYQEQKAKLKSEKESISDDDDDDDDDDFVDGEFEPVGSESETDDEGEESGDESSRLNSFQFFTTF